MNGNQEGHYNYGSNAGSISGASFVVWVLPQNHGSSAIVVSDFKSELDSVKERHLLITTSIESNLKALSDNNMTPDEFINQTQISSVQNHLIDK